MLFIALIQIIISCAFAGSLYGDKTKQLFHGGDINTKALDSYMKLFGDNMQFCHKGESNGCMNKQEFNKLIQDKYIVNGEKTSPYFDYKVSNHDGNSDHGVEEIEVEFSVKHSGCTITRHETQEIHYNKNMVKKVVIKDSKDQKRVCGNNGDQRKLLMNDPVPIKVKPSDIYYGDVTTKSPTKSTKVWATDMPSKAPTAPQGHIVTSPSPTMEPTTTSTTTFMPTTSQPTTHNPTTSVPTTANSTTSNPTTSKPTTSKPTFPPSESPTTFEPTQTPTTEPTTENPATSTPTTADPTTADPTTSEPTKEPTTTLQPTGSPLPIPPIATRTPTKEPTPPQGLKVTTESPTSSGSTTSESSKSWEKSSWKKSSNSKRNKEGKSSRRLLDTSNTGYGYYVQTTTKSPTKKVWPTPSPTTTPKPSRSPSTPSPITPSPITPSPITPSPTTANPTTNEPTTPYPTTTNPTTPVPTAPISIDCDDIISDVYPLRHVWFRFDLSFNAQSVTFSACNSDFSTILELYDSSATQLIAFEGDGCGLIVGSMSAGVYNLKLSSDQVEIEGDYQLQIICENTPLPTTQPPSFPEIPQIATPIPTVPVNALSRAPTPRPVESYGYWEKSHDHWNKNYNYDDEHNGGKWYKYDNYGYDDGKYDDGRGYKYGKKGGKKGKYGRKWY